MQAGCEHAVSTGKVIDLFQSLASLKDDGLCVLGIPFEWASRPSVRALRDFIAEQKREVNVYRPVDTTFSSVLTTSSITIVASRSAQAAGIISKDG